MTYASNNSYLGLAKESTYGLTPASGAIYIPVTNPQTTPAQKFLSDDALRGSPVLLYDMVQGVRNDDFEGKFYVYADTAAYFFLGILGGPDSVTGTAAPYTHAIKALNNPANGSQPPSFTLMDFDGANYFLMNAGVVESIKLTAGAEAAAELDVKFITNPYVSSTTAPAPFSTPVISTESLVPGWNVAVTSGGTTGPGGTGGTTFSYINNVELTINRKTVPIFTNGQQAPFKNFAGPIEVSGKFTAVVASNNDPWSTGTGAQALTRSQSVLTVSLIDPNNLSSSTPQSINLGMSQVQYENPKRTRGKEFVEVEVEFMAESNASDSSVGFSPLQFWAINSQSAAY